MRSGVSTIRFISDPKDGKQLASLVVMGFGTMNFAWANTAKPLLRELAGGIKVTIRRTDSVSFRCVIENDRVVIHDVELELIERAD